MLTPVTLRGNYLVTVGKVFIPFGVNWVPAKYGMHWPIEWDSTQVETDFAQMCRMGFNTIRFDLVWGWFEPNPGNFNQDAFTQFDYFISLAHRYGIYLNPIFLVGGEVGDAYWDVTWRNGRHPHHDPDLIEQQVRHVQEFAKRYNSEPAILAWDLTDEPPFWIVADCTDDSMARNWTRSLCEGIREFDPNHIILCGTLGQESGRGPFRADVISPYVDVQCVHPYPIYDPALYREPLLSTRTTYGASFEIMLSRGVGQPVIMQEFGAGNSQFSPRVVGLYYNTFMYSALAAGVQGYVAWCFTDASPNIYGRAPYIRCPHETQFGITDYQGKVKPAGLEMEHFSKILKHIDFDAVQLAEPETGIIIPHEWTHGPDYDQYSLPANQSYKYTANDILHGVKDKEIEQFTVKNWLTSYILGRQAGLNIGFPRELDNWSNLKLIITPASSTISPDPICHLYTTFWHKVKAVVESGTVLYTSVCGKSAISTPEVEQLFGVQFEDRSPWQSIINLTVIEDFFSLRKGDVLEIQLPKGIEAMGMELEVIDAKVLAVDQDGRPALVTKQVGEGYTVLCAYPLEYGLGDTENALERPGFAQDLYKSLKQLAQIQSKFSTDNPALEINWLSGNHQDYIIVVNHSGESVNSIINASIRGRAGIILADGVHNENDISRSFVAVIPGYSGQIYLWEHAD